MRSKLVDALKGEALRAEWARVFGKPTASKDSARLREQLKAHAKQAQARESAPDEPSPDWARLAAAKVGVGDLLTRTTREGATVTCVVRRAPDGAPSYVYAGKGYSSISAAANAASADLGKRSTNWDGWYFWHVEKRA